MKKTMYVLLALAAAAFVASGACELWNKLNPPEDLFEEIGMIAWTVALFLMGIALSVFAGAVAVVRACFTRRRDKLAKHRGILTKDGIPWLP